MSVERRPFQIHRLKLHVARDRDLLYRAREMFWGKLDKPYLDWLYYQNPAGLAYCNLAMDQELIVGQYLVIPITMMAWGRPITASLSLNTFTHADYRRQGIFVALAEDLYRYISESGVVFTIGFPNDRSRPGFLSKLGFTEPIRTGSLTRLLRIPGIPNGGVNRALALLPAGWFNRTLGTRKQLRFEITWSPEKAWFDELWERQRTRQGFGLLKDGKWVEWRYLTNPIRKYRFLLASTTMGMPVGYTVWEDKPDDFKTIQDVVRPIDFVAVDTGTQAALIQALLDQFACHAHAISFYTSFYTTLFRLLIVNGFMPTRVRSPFIFRLHNSSFNVPRLLRPGAWQISGCYIDTM